ncbi:amino acid adenylation domain-containing protein, partial [Kordia zhangzhouensis]|uniref:amino acid adenylation domain-containing protein n=1 Tax=Kordia zhangzhouensis TaxID=1620405 RepID=UPI0006292F67
IAVVYEDRKFTYEQLHLESNQFANYLMANYKVEVEDFIALKIPRSDFWIVCLLGILKTGGVYIPIDPIYPQARIDYIETDSNCKFIIDEKVISTYIKEKHLYDVTFQGVEFDTSSLAYIIYTSGSTGKPKGVLIEHNGIINTVLALIDSFQIKEEMKCLQFANQCFDASIWEILSTLLSGASLYIIEDAKKFDLSFFEDYLNANKIDATVLPPALVKTLVISNLKHLKTLITAGEEAPLHQVKLFQSQGGRYINSYGPTEASVCATTYEGIIEDSVPIGKPISNTEAYIFDELHNILPVGVTGELCIGGSGLARGYLNREALTQEKFIPHPFKTGKRLYKTGDMARWLPDGNIEFIGRKDNQVKIRGYRVELGEIESILLKYEGISNGCILAKKDTIGNNKLIGYIVIDGNFDKKALELFLESYLPSYMI